MGTLALNFALAHKDYLYGVASGYALTHVPQATAFAFHQAMRIPLLRELVLKNPDESKKVLDDIATELKKDIDAEALPKSVPPADSKPG